MYLLELHLSLYQTTSWNMLSPAMPEPLLWIALPEAKKISASPSSEASALVM